MERASLVAGPLKKLGLPSLFLLWGLGSLGSGLVAAEPADVIASASYAGGACQLRLISTSQGPSPQGRKRYNVNLELQFETLPRKSDGSTPPLPDGYYLNSDKSPLVAAYVMNGKVLAKVAPSGTGSAKGKDGVVTINDLEVGDARPRLQNVEIEVAVVRVTEWETQTFNAPIGGSDFFKCGAFELRAMSDGKQVKVDAMAYPQFRAEHDAYRVKVPLAFLDPTYAMGELKIVDAAGNSPSSAATITPGSGAVSSTFTNWRAPAKGYEIAATADSIAYPITLSVRLPKRYTTERIKFKFAEIPLPAPKPGA
ncbi:MAG TPA: hypothetical protein VHO24_04395 [Opitutaceae bacterium]|nr:hypothetical protein [Opitutaceae bacterium]